MCIVPLRVRVRARVRVRVKDRGRVRVRVKVRVRVRVSDRSSWTLGLNENPESNPDELSGGHIISIATGDDRVGVSFPLVLTAVVSFGH